MSTLLTRRLAVEGTEAYPRLRPAEVVGLQPASRTANLLAGLLGGAAVLALALTLSSSVRRRRRRPTRCSRSLGFDRGELRRTVRWQTNIVTVLALAIGLPLGVVAGRLAWTAFADQLGAAGGPQVPLGLLGIAAVGDPPGCRTWSGSGRPGWRPGLRPPARPTGREARRRARTVPEARAAGRGRAPPCSRTATKPEASASGGRSLRW